MMTHGHSHEVESIAMLTARIDNVRSYILRGNLRWDRNLGNYVLDLTHDETKRRALSA